MFGRPGAIPGFPSTIFPPILRQKPEVPRETISRYHSPSMRQLSQHGLDGVSADLQHISIRRSDSQSQLAQCLARITLIARTAP